jgi:hypothetical protein
LLNIKTLSMNNTENLKCHIHLHFLCASLSKVYYIIKSLKDVMSFQLILTICYAYLQSRMKYCIIFWGTERDSVNVFHVQRRIIRLISGVKTCDPCRHIFMEYGILTVASLHILEVLCSIKKFKGYLKHNFPIHRYNKRSNNDLHTLNCNTALFQKNVVNMSVKLYNRLPERIRTFIDFKSFKKHIKLLISNYFFICTIKEFLQLHQS